VMEVGAASLRRVMMAMPSRTGFLESILEKLWTEQALTWRDRHGTCD
jgi:hypothetical protein